MRLANILRTAAISSFSESISDAYRARSGYGYKACTKQPGLGGSAAVCTGVWWV
ncbi:hypothetical protein ACTMTF_20530 [Nonomuraea sp. ZG12]|uniref:hypothetical protein n=1 Tax=Nonomuraea sp. ZG12 TaxID=3452207 RepID=UPI003F8AE88C